MYKSPVISSNYRRAFAHLTTCILLKAPRLSQLHSSLFSIPLSLNMAVLIPFSRKDLTANFDAQQSILTVTANGLIPGTVVSADFDRLGWPGGIKLRLEGFFGGLGKPQPTKLFFKTWSETGLIPLQFGAVLVVIANPETGKEVTAEMSITHGPTPVPALQPQPLPTAPTSFDKPTADATVLPDISIDLAINQFVRIPGEVPDPSKFTNALEGRTAGSGLQV
jgi:hypothetical protein